MESYCKILVIRFSSIGDIVLTTPIVRALKQQLKNVEIHYLTKKSNYSSWIRFAAPASQRIKLRQQLHYLLLLVL